MATKDLVLDIAYRLRGENFSKVKREMGTLATNFNKQMSNALLQATKGAGLKVTPQLERLKASGLRLQKLLGEARTKAEREEILAKEKGFKSDFQQVRLLTKRRLDAQKALKEDLTKGFGDSAQEYGDQVGEAIGDAVDLSLSGLKGSLRTLGASLRKGGEWMKSKETAGPMGLMVKLLGKMVSGIGLLAVKMGMAAGIAGLLMAAVSKVANHGAEMNRAVLEGGAALGDFAEKGEKVQDTLRGVRNAFQDVEHNLSWMQTGAEQMKIIGAFKAAGGHIKAMKDGIASADEKMKNMRKTVEAATTYASLLNMEASEVAENMAGYMNELGTSLDGIRERFAAVYDVAEQSGFGTKRFFGMVLQATSGMTMYNVRLEETAGLLMQLGKMLGQKGAEQMMQGLTGPAYGSRKEAFVGTKMMGEGKQREIVKSEASKTSRELLRVVQEQGFSGQKATEEMAKRGLKIDFTSIEGLTKSLGKASKKDRVEILKAATEMGLGDDVVRQIQKSFDLMTGATSKSTTDLATAASSVGPQAQMLQKLYAVNKVIPTAIEDMSFTQAIGYQEMKGMSEQDFKQLQTLSIMTKKNHELLNKAQKQNLELNKKDPKFQIAERKKQVQQTGMYINKMGERIVANDPNILDMDEEQLREYEKANKIGNSLLDYQNNVGAAAAKVTEAQLDKQTQLAIDIRQNTEDFTKRLQIGTEVILSEIYDLMLNIISFISGEDPKEAKAKKEALDAIRDQKSELSFQLQKQLAKTSELSKQLEKLPEGSEKRKEKEKELEQAEIAQKSLESSLLKVGKMQSHVTSKEVMSSLKGLFKGGGRFDLQDFMVDANNEAAKQMGGLVTTFERKLTDEQRERIDLLAQEEAASQKIRDMEDVKKGFKTKAEVDATWGGPDAMAKMTKLKKEEILAAMTAGGQLTKTGGGAGRADTYKLTTTAARETADQVSYAMTRANKAAAHQKLMEEKGAISEGLKSGDLETVAGAVARSLPIDMAKFGDTQKAILEVLEGKKDVLPPKLAAMLKPKMEELKSLGLGSEQSGKLGGGSKDPTDLLASMTYATQESRDAFIKKMQEEEKDKPQEEQFYTKTFLKDQPQEWGKIFEKVMAKRDEKALAGKLRGMGAEDADSMAAGLMSGGALGYKQEEWIKQNRGALQEADLPGQAQGSIGRITKNLNDFIWRPGSPPARISDQDVLMGGKAGGPLAKGSKGGGGGAVINHFYNDSKGFLANQSKMKRAMTGYA